MATMVLVESYQQGQFLQATFQIQNDEWGQFISVPSKKEIERLKKLYDEYREWLGK